MIKCFNFTRTHIQNEAGGEFYSSFDMAPLNAFLRENLNASIVSTTSTENTLTILVKVPA